MKFTFIRAIFTITVLSMAALANAGIITDTNNDSFVDETTGLEWMDFGINNHLTYNQVAAQLGVGGLYEGWIIAQSAQTERLFRNVFLGLGVQPTHDEVDRVEIRHGNGTQASLWTEVYEIIGHNYDWSRSIGTHGLFRSAFGDGTGVFHNFSFTEFESIQPFTDRLTWLDRTIPNPNNPPAPPPPPGSDLREQTHLTYSTMLVRGSVQVPEPTTLAIFTLGIIGLFRLKGL